MADLMIYVEKDDDLVAEKLNNKEWQKCPGCGIVTEKIDGCNYVECCAIKGFEHEQIKCGTKWCWICQKIKGNEDGKCQWNHPEHNSH